MKKWLPIIWFLTIMIIYGNAFFDPFTVNDDVRNQLFIFHEVKNPGIYGGYDIAEFVKYDLPFGYFYLFYVLTYVSGDIVLISKLLTVFVAMATCFAAFKVGKKYYGHNVGVLFSFIFLLTIWTFPSLSGGLPRSFAYLIVLCVLFFMEKPNHLSMLISLFFGLIFYPLTALIGALIFLINEVMNLSNSTRSKRSMMVIAVFFFVTLLIYPPSSGVNRAASYSEVSNLEIYTADRGMVDYYPIKSIFLLIWNYSWFLLIPFFIFLVILKFRLNIRPEFYCLCAAGIILYFIASFSGFSLHYYDRYIRYTFPLFFSLAISLGIVKLYSRNYLIAVMIFLLTILSAVSAIDPDVIRCEDAELYGFLSDTDVAAGFPTDMDCVPLYSKTKVIVGREWLFYENPESFKVMDRKLKDSIKAYYGDESEIMNFCAEYGVDYFVFNDIYFNLSFIDKSYLLNYFKILVKESYKPDNYFETPNDGMFRKGNLFLFNCSA